MVNAHLTLRLSATLPDTRIARLTRDLERDLNRAGIKAEPVEAESSPGERGEPITLGVLALALISSGALKGLVGCLKTYLSREPSLVIKVQHPNGSQVEINSRNVDAADVRAALEVAASPQVSGPR
jgi:hypothetical protein